MLLTQRRDGGGGEFQSLGSATLNDLLPIEARRYRGILENQVVQRFKREQETFVFNTIYNWKPMEIEQNWSDVGRALGVGE